MKVLVTGGAGFIGSHIVDLLLTQGAQVVVVDDLSRGKKENLANQAVFYQLDVRSVDLTALIFDEKIDYVIHQAAQIDVQTSLERPAFDASVNILGTLNVLEASLKAGVKKVVYASSAASYGEPQYLPIDEDHPLNSQSGYGLSKQAGENYLSLYKKIHGLNFTVLRYANVYGPRQDGTGEGGVVAIFTENLSRSKKPTIFGDGAQTRDFIFVGDVARANVMALLAGHNTTLNVSTGEGTSVNHLYHTMAQLLGKKTEPHYTAARLGDIKDSFLDNQRIREALNWAPKMTLTQGLKLTLQHHEMNPEPIDAKKMIG